MNNIFFVGPERLNEEKKNNDKIQPIESKCAVRTAYTNRNRLSMNFNDSINIDSWYFIHLKYRHYWKTDMNSIRKSFAMPLIYQSPFRSLSSEISFHWELGSLYAPIDTLNSNRWISFMKWPLTLSNKYCVIWMCWMLNGWMEMQMKSGKWSSAFCQTWNTRRDRESDWDWDWEWNWEWKTEIQLTSIGEL